MTKAGAASSFVDPSVNHFYRGLADIQIADASGCLQSDSRMCDFDVTLGKLSEAIQDFSDVLTRHPQHLGSLWHRGLAYAKFCSVEARAGRESRTTCDRAIDDFSAAMNTPADPTFLAQLPDRADILWNRGFTHLIEARFKTLARRERLAEYESAIRDFDGVLKGGTAYAPFLNRRRADVLKHRTVADQERAQLQQSAP